MKISFIIPAYNVENYISKCLDSIINQPYSDFEIIIVNDGSTDATPVVIDSYSQRDSRVRVFHQANSGQGAARSFGLTQAFGEYVWFVDADDWLIDSVLPRISKVLSQFIPDVMVINFEFSFDDRAAVPSSLVPSYLVGEIVDPIKDVGTFAAISCWNTPPWRLISRRQHLVDADIQFAKGVFYEDHPFAIQLMLTAHKVYVDGCVSYAYYQRSSSTTKVNDRKAFDFLEIRRQCLSLFRRYGNYDTLASIVVGYIAPANFYNAHVDEIYREEFINKLSKDLTDDEFSFVQKHGDQTARLFLDAVKARDPSLIARRQRISRLRDRYSKDGARRFFLHVKNLLKKRMVDHLLRLKNIVFRHTHHLGVDTSGRQYIESGVGTRIEAIYIDVRVKPESRTYLRVGDYSHVGGTFVFERGVGNITIGKKSSIGGGCKIICTQEDGVHIGNNVMLAWDCTLMDSDAHSLNPDIRMNDAYDWKCGVDANQIGAYKDWSQVKSGPIVIEDNAWLGFEVAVMKGVRIGRGAVIGARSLVASDVAPYCVYAGNPARFVRFVPRDIWSWEDIIDASQANPKMQKMLEDAYLVKDVVSSLKRYRSSGEFLEALAEIRHYAPHARKILDVGGASGVMAIAFALEGYEVTLVEPSHGDIVGIAGAKRLINYATKEFDSSIKDRVKLIHGFVEDLDVDDKFDVVHCRQVVHHFTKPTVALAKIRNLVNKNGIIFLVREHVIFDEEDKQQFLKTHPFHIYTGGENAYKAEEYVKFIIDAGFTLLRQYSFAETLINCHPHEAEYCRSIDEREIAGRPYSFIARNVEIAI